ncbi:hypothetical protein FJ955_25000 [Mesorhizobium sp. B2-2-2]|nr:hypothetical protein FJ955_25000 [Mesorhizobium sp. B2-2-2]
MTPIQGTTGSGNANQPPNDHDDHAPGLLSAVSLMNEENIAALVRRTERVAILVILGMGGWLMLVPAIYHVLSHGI